MSVNVSLFLRGHPFFREISDSDLERLSEMVEVDQLEDGEFLIRSGDPGDCAYLVVSGRLRVVVADSEGEPQFVRYAKTREMVGEMALLTGESRSAHVQADGVATVLRLTSTVFEHLVRRYPSLGEVVSKLLIERLITLDREKRIVGPYQLIDRLGMGGMGVVFRAIHSRLNRSVAIKFLYHHHALNDEYRSSFERETNIISSLDHPNIVRVQDAGEAFRTLYLVMELVEGKTLSQLQNSQGPFSVRKVRRIVREVLSALGYAASLGIIHRDVKPQNIILDRSGKTLLTDFGLAMYEHMSQEEDLYGTVEYVSPEQIEGGAIDGRADLYSLGITAYEMLSGSPPFMDADPYRILDGHMKRGVPYMQDVVPHCPADLAEFIDRSTRRDPGDRFQTAQEALAVLDRGGAETGVRRRQLEVEFEEAFVSDFETAWNQVRDQLEATPGVRLCRELDEGENSVSP